MKYIMTVTLLFFIGCGGSPESKMTPPKAKGSDGGQDYDTNGDGKADSWKFFTAVDGKQVLARKEFDINFDGKVDIWQRYDLKGSIVLGQMDINFKISVNLPSRTTVQN